MSIVQDTAKPNLIFLTLNTGNKLTKTTISTTHLTVQTYYLVETQPYPYGRNGCSGADPNDRELVKSTIKYECTFDHHDSNFTRAIEGLNHFIENFNSMDSTKVMNVKLDFIEIKSILEPSDADIFHGINSVMIPYFAMPEIIARYPYFEQRFNVVNLSIKHFTAQLKEIHSRYDYSEATIILLPMFERNT